MKVPSAIVLHKKTRALEISYPDGKQYMLPCEFLRVYSPSAEVAGHTPEEAVLQYGKKNVEIDRIEMIGNYALRLYFSDKHDTGIYSWEYLEELCFAQDALWREYLAKLEAAGLSREPSPGADKQ